MNLHNIGRCLIEEVGLDFVLNIWLLYIKKYMSYVIYSFIFKDQKFIEYGFKQGINKCQRG